MKTLRITLVLIFFLGISIHSNSYAKVLPIIEGAEMIDTLASQNNEITNLPELSVGIYKNIDFEPLIYCIDKYPFLVVMYKRESLLTYPSMSTSCNFLLILKPYKELIFNKQIPIRYNLVNI